MSEEEELAREALGKIRAWTEKKKAIEGESFIPRLAVQFCGGCNPVIERVALAQIIRQDLSGDVQWVSGEEEADLLLIIEGCLTGCADRPEVRKRAGACLIIRDHEVSEVEKNI